MIRVLAESWEDMARLAAAAACVSVSLLVHEAKNGFLRSSLDGWAVGTTSNIQGEIATK